MFGRQTRRPLAAAVICMLLFVSCLRADTPPAGVERIYYAVEIDGVLCGYAVFDVATVTENGRTFTHIDENLSIMAKALGMAFNSEIKLTYRVDPETGRFTHHTSYVKQGDVEISSSVVVEGDTARMTSSMSEKPRVTPLLPGVLLENTLEQSFLIRDFADAAITEKTYDTYDTRTGEIEQSTYTRTGADTLELAGAVRPALVFDELNLTNGSKSTWWIDPVDGRVLKVIPLSDRLVYLTDGSVIKRIETADLDGIILEKTNVSIADIPGIVYMKVQAAIEPVGLWVTPENLNIPGQSFEGSVVNNLIEGVFEIEHRRYDGADAPPFPPDFGGDATLREYLEPTEFIQSADRVLVEKARDITAGAADSWEAATRISEWVAENIGYAIPGGGTARKTYDIRAGECGAHSFLTAAFCRAVGIPARVVWGCMYTPQLGGSFGQHGWNEIYMGDAGWIAIDATLGENDFVDSGHIRFGVLQSPVVAFNPRKMEILEYRLRDRKKAHADSAGAGPYDMYTGEYQGREEILTLSVTEGRLSLDIPNRMVLAFDEPDSAGKWRCTVSPRLFLTFDRTGDGTVAAMLIHEIITMPRKSDPDLISNEVPEEYRRYLGVYRFEPMNADFTVLYRDRALAVNNPLEKRVVELRPPDQNGVWMDEFDKNAITFETDEAGAVTALVIDAISTLPRKK